MAPGGGDTWTDPEHTGGSTNPIWPNITKQFGIPPAGTDDSAEEKELLMSLSVYK